MGRLSLHSDFPDPQIFFHSFDFLSERAAQCLSPHLDLRNLVVRDLPTIKFGARNSLLIES